MTELRRRVFGQFWIHPIYLLYKRFMRFARALSSRRARKFCVVPLAAACLLATAVSAWALGELRQKVGAAACISEDGSGGACAIGLGLDGATAIAVSPDGRSAYVVGRIAGTLTTFDRNPATGALTQKPAKEGCYAEGGSASCEEGVGLKTPLDVAVSSDGKNVYVASFGSSAIAVFDRNPTTGALTQKPGKEGCYAAVGSATCEEGVGLNGMAGITLSSDGKTFYAVGSAAATTFDRNPTTGALTQKPAKEGCYAEVGSASCEDGVGLSSAQDVTLSPDGKNLYVASFSSAAVTTFDRNLSTGVLAQKPAKEGCYANVPSASCEGGVGLEGAAHVAVSPDGKNVYVSSVEASTVTTFDRNPTTGALTQKPAKEGCYGGAVSPSCENGVAFGKAGSIVLSSDGKNLYLAAFGSNALSLFDRDPATGVLTQKPAKNACYAAVGSASCEAGVGLGGVAGIALSPDGKDLYVASIESDAVAAFDRNVPDTVAPLVAGFAVSPRRFKAGRGKPRLAFTLSEPATAKLGDRADSSRSPGRQALQAGQLKTEGEAALQALRQSEGAQLQGPARGSGEERVRSGKGA